MQNNCLFCNIAKGIINSEKVYEDDEFIAFNDIKPIAKIHILLIPKKHIISMQYIDDSDTELLGKMMILISKIAKLHCNINGFRLINNSGFIAKQEIMHLHFHIISDSNILK
ncbi:putative HIT-like protein [Candidatus Kinetoplastibacterium sorsogonicusi]|uniref:Putative HIT-like protein n=1 Tax=Candidatus Kinetoplastidibacterium kentomonadis TaxID=1576550 RepID=A0A3S7J909_9PROT|nr:HIT domain-containing protein [Candidatus Kinetoplastibacterium sorsogonicusi]AWD32162.1 putative HIT-like protein [Candidatus Kinetoplastibacterium sorsogonicusi]